MSGLLANVVWPALYLMNRNLTPDLIFVSILFEAWLLLRYLHRYPRQAIALAVTANALSAAIGCVLLPAWGWHWCLYYEPSRGTFHTANWAATCVFSGILSSLVEGTWIYLWTGPKRGLVFATVVGNSATVLLAYLSFSWWSIPQVEWMPEMAWKLIWW